MTHSDILLVSRHPEELQPLIEKMRQDYNFQMVESWDVCMDQHQRNNKSCLTLIDTDLLAADNDIASLTKEINGKVVIIGREWSEKKQIEAFASGVSGYCDKKISPDLLIRVIESVLNGEIWVPRHLIPKVISSLIEKNIWPLSRQEESGAITEKKERLNTLSEREMQVALMIARGNVNKKIAMMLSITERTVKAHLSNIFKKLDLQDRIQLAIFMKGLED